MHFMTYTVTINSTFSFIKDQYANTILYTTINKSLNLSTLITSPRQTLFLHIDHSFQHESKSDTLWSERIRLYAYIVDRKQQ